MCFLVYVKYLLIKFGLYKFYFFDLKKDIFIFINKIVFFVVLDLCEIIKEVF